MDDTRVLLLLQYFTTTIEFKTGILRNLQEIKKFQIQLEIDTSIQIEILRKQLLIDGMAILIAFHMSLQMNNWQ